MNRPAHYRGPSSPEAGLAAWRALAALAALLLVVGGALYIHRSMDRTFVIDGTMGLSLIPRPGSGAEDPLASPALAGVAIEAGAGRAPVGPEDAAMATDPGAVTPQWTGPPNRARVRLLVERGGAPLPGCRVTPERADSATFEGPTRDHGVTDAKGLVAIIAPPGRTVLLAIQDPEEGTSISSAVTSPFAQTERLVRVSFPSQESGPTVVVRVVDCLTGGPLPNTAARFHTGSGFLQLDTDQEGCVSVPLEKNGRVHFERDGFSDYTLRYDSRRAVGEVTVELIPTASLFGRVDGEIPPGASVEVQLWNPVDRDPLSGDLDARKLRILALSSSRMTMAKADVQPGGNWEIKELAFPEGVEHFEQGSIRFSAGAKSRTLAAGLQIRPRDRLHVPDPMEGGQPWEIQVQYPNGDPVLGPLVLTLQMVGQDGIRQVAKPLGEGRYSMELAPPGDWQYSFHSFGAQGQLAHDGVGRATIVLDGRGYVTVVMPELGLHDRRNRIAWESTDTAQIGVLVTALARVGAGETSRLDGVPLGVDGRVVVRSKDASIPLEDWNRVSVGTAAADLKFEYQVLAACPARAGDRDVKPIRQPSKPGAVPSEPQRSR